MEGLHPEAAPPTQPKREIDDGGDALTPNGDGKRQKGFSSKEERRRLLEEKLRLVEQLCRKIERSQAQLTSTPVPDPRRPAAVLPPASAMPLAAPPYGEGPPRHRLPPITVPEALGDDQNKPKRTPKLPNSYSQFETELNPLLPPPPVEKQITVTRQKLAKKPPAAIASTPSAPLNKKAYSEAFKHCKNVVSKHLRKHEKFYIFQDPVDPVKLGIPDYFTVITSPMDLGTAEKRLIGNMYETPEQYAHDVRLTFANAKKYNPPGNWVHEAAVAMEVLFERLWEEVPPPRPVADMPAVPGGGSQTDLVRRVQQLEQALRSGKKGRGDELRPMTPAEKKVLSENINKLPQDKLGRVVQIIQESVPQSTSTDGEEIEIDIDALDAKTLRKLERFVNQSLGLKKKAPASTVPYGAGNPPGVAAGQASDSVGLQEESSGGESEEGSDSEDSSDSDDSDDMKQAPPGSASASSPPAPPPSTHNGTGGPLVKNTNAWLQDAGSSGLDQKSGGDRLFQEFCSKAQLEREREEEKRKKEEEARHEAERKKLEAEREAERERREAERREHEHRRRLEEERAKERALREQMSSQTNLMEGHDVMDEFSSSIGGSALNIPLKLDRSILDDEDDMQD